MKRMSGGDCGGDYLWSCDGKVMRSDGQKMVW